jgi:hypothetical protein
MYLIKFPKYHIKTMTRDFNAKTGGEDVFKPTFGYEILHEICNEIDARVVNFATTKETDIRSTMFPNRKIHKFTLISPDGKTHNQIDHILIDRRRHSTMRDVRSFRVADCDTDHYLMVANLGRY